MRSFCADSGMRIIFLLLHRRLLCLDHIAGHLGDHRDGLGAPIGIALTPPLGGRDFW